VSAHCVAVLADKQLVAIVLDFVNPLGAGWRLVALYRLGGHREPGRELPFQHDQQVCCGGPPRNAWETAAVS
jgi:hypothetical protein